jgi:hypothetical protein
MTKTQIKEVYDGLSKEDMDALNNTNQGLKEYMDIGKNNPFEYNCYKTVNTFELRRRGMKVKAKPPIAFEKTPNRQLRTREEKLSIKPEVFWLDAKTKRNIIAPKIKFKNLDYPMLDITKYIKNNYEENTKKVYTLSWTDINVEFSCIIIIQETNGNIYFINPSIGSTYPGSKKLYDARSVLEEEFFFEDIDLSSIIINRIDNEAPPIIIGGF